MSYLWSGLRSKVRVNVTGQGKISGGQRSILGAQSAAKSNSPHYQSEVFVCVSVISGHMWIIARMQAIVF